MDTVATPAHAAQVSELFREHNRALIAYLQCRLNSLSDAQELAQEAYMRIFTLEQPEQVGSLRAYLFRIAANLAVDRLRIEQMRDLRKALRELPAKTSRAFVMHMIEGRDFSVVAQAMKISERMVRYHVSNALAHCRARVDEPGMP
nr:RNA polymerase sigma factor [Dyella silvatica]